MMLCAEGHLCRQAGVDRLNSPDVQRVRCKPHQKALIDADEQEGHGVFDFDPATVTPEELERIAQRAEAEMSKLAEAMNRLNEVTGEGAAAGGKIQATVESDGLVREIRLDPRVLRTMGTDELAEAIVAALRAAQFSARGQLEERLAAAQGGDRPSFDMAEVSRRLEAIQSAFLSSLPPR
jgi:DNA-binding protein YbaB